ncbi:MAG TPA: hypothetical protein VGU27_12160, partial [Candidatus Eisenbacteria bacterium]|nr:hypothetical protein [Candidatus Eisenbacteria bacterium]
MAAAPQCAISMRGALCFVLDPRATGGALSAHGRDRLRPRTPVPTSPHRGPSQGRLPFERQHSTLEPECAMAASRVAARLALLLLPPAVSLPLALAAANAAWLPNGNLQAIGTDYQMCADCAPISMAPDAARGAYLVADGFGLAPFLFRVPVEGGPMPGWPASGGPGWPAGAVLYKGDLVNDPRAPAVVADDSGGVFVVCDLPICSLECIGVPEELLVQRVRPDGEFAAGWAQEGVFIWSGANAPSSANGPLVPRAVSDGRGGLLVTWSKGRPHGPRPTPVELAIQRVDGSRATPWGFGGIVLHPPSALPYHQAIAPDGEGGAYVFWRDTRAPGLYGQHVTSSGAITWAPDGIPIASSAATLPGWPVAIPDGAHGAIVAWAGAAGARAGVFAVRVTPRGDLPWGGDRQVAESDDLPELAMVPAGEGAAILAWRDSSTGVDRLLAQRLSRQGRQEWADGGAPVCTATGRHDRLAMAGDHRGGAYLAWSDDRAPFSTYALHLGPRGEPAPGWLVDGSPVGTPLHPGPTGRSFARSLGIASVEGPAPTAEEVAARAPGRAGDPDGDDGARDEGAIMAWTDEPDIPFPGYFGDLALLSMRLTPGGPAAAPVVPGAGGDAGAVPPAPRP